MPAMAPLMWSTPPRVTYRRTSAPSCSHSSRSLTLWVKETIWSRRAWCRSTGASGAISASLFSRRRARHSGISSTLGSVRSEARMYRGPNSAACRTVERRSHAIRAAAIGVR